MPLSCPIVAEGAEAIAGVLAGGLAGSLGPYRAVRWTLHRDRYRPRVVTVARGQITTAAALITARPATAAMKIVDAWWSDGTDIASLLDALIALARTERAAVLKWELHSDGELPQAALLRGFVPMTSPARSSAGEPVRGHALWLHPIPHPEPRHYRQTTEFTCGAVASLVAAELAGQAGFTGDQDDRRREMDFWRQASIFPACEPVGLAVALRRHIGTGHAVRVTVNPDVPVFLDEFDGFQREFRLELLDDSRRHARELGVPIRDERVSVGQIAARVAGGDVALLLISQEPMHGQSEPHWVTAHASDGTSVVVMQDPWIDEAAGETWVDAHELPVRLPDLDRMCSWGQDSYRGVVFLTESGRGSRFS